jgi:hypothetical protein
VAQVTLADILQLKVMQAQLRLQMAAMGTTELVEAAVELVELETADPLGLLQDQELQTQFLAHLLLMQQVEQVLNLDTLVVAQMELTILAKVEVELVKVVTGERTLAMVAQA